MLTNNKLIKVWEQGSYLQPFDYGNLLLKYACDELNDIDNLSMGEREGLLLELRMRLFGKKIQAESICKECSEKMDVDFNVEDILFQKKGKVENKESMIKLKGINVVIRPVKVSDMRHVIMQGAGRDDERMLLEKCILSIKRGKKDVQLSQLSDSLIDTIADSLSELDPLSEVVLNYACPECASTSSHVFDVCSFLKQEIEQYVKNLLVDVHWLSSAYGWSEADILAMGTQRRKIYIGMISA